LDHSLLAKKGGNFTTNDEWEAVAIQSPVLPVGNAGWNYASRPLLANK
jgi:hypothetical protein